MDKYKILNKGDKTEFESEQTNINRWLEVGYKIVGEIDANSIGEARYKHENKSATAHISGPAISSHESENPTGYLKVTSTLFLVLSLIGCIFLVSQGLEASDSFETRRYAGIYYASAFSCFVLTLLIHSVCRLLVYIANK